MGAEEVIAIGESRRVNYTEVASPAITDICSGGRRLLVAMKLNTSCREMLTWTIAKLAQPGDHILALHVSSQPFREGASVEEEESHAKQLANTLRGVLSVYESLCNLKQIKLQLEIVTGYKVKNVLVEVASSYEACKLILGANKSFSVGRTKALGRYCLKRLPSTCTVVILEQGDIIFDKKGRLGADMTRLDMIKVFRRSMRIGKHKNQESQQPQQPNQDPDNYNNNNSNYNSHAKTRHSNGRQRSVSEIPDYTTFSTEMSFGSCSSILNEDFSTATTTTTTKQSCPSNSAFPRSSSSGFEALRMSFSKRRAAQAGAQRTDMRTFVGADVCADLSADVRKDLRMDARTDVRQDVSADVRTDMFLMDRNDACRKSSKGEDGEVEEEEAIVPGWPLLKNNMGFEKKKKVVKTSKVLTKGLRLRMDYGVCDGKRECCVFGYEALDVATARFSRENVVGLGGGSEVFRGVLQDGRVVAVKRLNPGPQAEEELWIDIEINTTLTHTHIVSLLGYCVEASQLLLVYDYLPQGNLEDHLHASGKGAAVLPWEVRHKVAVGIARALHYLHKGCTRPVVHRDVKTSNILLTADFESQLSDFGLAKWAPTMASHLLCNDVVGTFGYLAPEYFMFGRVNDKTDVYAFGVVLLELITGRKPIDTSRPKGEENLVNWARPLLEERDLIRLVDPLLGGVYDFVQINSMLIAAFLCIKQSAQQRPHMSQVLQVLSGDHDKNLSTFTAVSDSKSTSDFEEVDANNSDDANMRSHLALAMLGVDDDATSQCSVVDIPHSNKYLEEYLAGRFSRSASFED